MEQPDLHNPEFYINRELSLLAFNQRVLRQAKDTSVPLLERLRFLFIASHNLDEFFEVRVAAVKQHLALNHPYTHSSNAGISAEETLAQISRFSHEIVSEIYHMLRNILGPELRAEGIDFLDSAQWSHPQKKWIKDFFENEVLPVVSPIALDIAHPFPRLINKSLNFIVTLEGKDGFGRTSGLAIVHAPRSIPRAILLPTTLAKPTQFIFLTDVIYQHVQDLFPGMKVTGCYQFRITRNSDLLFDEESVDDLASALKIRLLDRRYGTAVRLEITDQCPMELAQYLLEKHELKEHEMYRVDGPVNLNRYMSILNLIDRPDLFYPAYTPGIPKILKKKRYLFNAISSEDILLHHPYQSFQPVIDLIRQATLDEHVIAIKQTLYRTGVESEMVQALVDAARAGKEVTAVVELRARFEEASNIELATRLQEAGVLVVYGIVGFKTHAKMMLIVRREEDGLQRYAHLGTGNYHSNTAKQYTDIGYLTKNIDICMDVQLLFHQLTGMGKPQKTTTLLQAPFALFDTLIALIEKEIEFAKQGKHAHIIMRANGLTDEKIIRALYRASMAGVQIDLIIRGICCLRPGIPGVSDHIRVRSVVGRFLEHSRIYYFHNNGKEVLYASSADLMERNLYHRIEVCFPITTEKMIKRVKYECLDLYLEDNCDAWHLLSDGTYEKVTQTSAPLCAQKILLEDLTENVEKPS
jgi:polyphosphate kinase